MKLINLPDNLTPDQLIDALNIVLDMADQYWEDCKDDADGDPDIALQIIQRKQALKAVDSVLRQQQVFVPDATLAIHLEGSLVQGIFTDTEDLPISALVYDYDTEGTGDDELYSFEPFNRQPGTVREFIAHWERLTHCKPLVDQLVEAVDFPNHLETYTVMLLYPDYLTDNYGQDVFRVAVRSTSSKDAVARAKIECKKSLDADGKEYLENLNDFYVVAIMKGEVEFVS